MRYQVGTKFTDRQGRECEVVDYLTTRNMAGDVVKTTYVTAHTLMGQKILDRDVCETTIARALWAAARDTARAAAWAAARDAQNKRLTARVTKLMRKRK